MEWTFFISSVGFIALVLTGSWLFHWGERHGKRGPLWSVLRVFVALQWLLDALPSDRSQVELPTGDHGPARSGTGNHRPQDKARTRAKRRS